MTDEDLVASDEAIFSLNSEINTRNVIKYATKGDGHPPRPDHYGEFSQGAHKVMVCTGWMARTGVVLSPHFIERNFECESI